jgi:hypothetical protein
MATAKRNHISMAEAPTLISDILAAGLVANLMSSPGVGKSDLAKQLATNNRLKLIDIRLSFYDPSDLNGFPFILNRDSKTERVRAGYVPMDTFPVQGDSLPKDENGTEMNGWLLLLDEFNSAPLTVQAAAYKLVLDKMVGMYPLHKNVAIITAGNLSTDKAIVNRLSTAMQSRIVSLVLRVCPDAWGIWADKHQIDHRIRSFIKFKPEMLHMFDPNHHDLTYPCPRTWEFLHKIIHQWKTIPGNKIPLLTGTVGEGAGQEFFAYCQIFKSLCTIEQILANPEYVKFGDDPSVHYALSGLVAHHMNEQNADDLMLFLKRLAIDFQVITLRAAIAKDHRIKNTKGVQQWIVHNADEMLGD